MADATVRLPEVPVFRAKRKSPDDAVNVKHANDAFLAILPTMAWPYLTGVQPTPRSSLWSDKRNVPVCVPEESETWSVHPPDPPEGTEQDVAPP